MLTRFKTNLSYVFAAVLLGLAAASLPALACSNLGPDKHLGVVQTIDAAKGELTVVDAESQKPIIFSIGADHLKDVKPKDTVIITFKSEEGRLRVEDLKRRSVPG